jgi:AraC family transcriptional regulator
MRQFDWTAEEHEHPQAQLSMLFQGNAASVLTHDEVGKTTKTGIVAESFVFIAPGQPHRVNWKSDGEILNLWIPQETLLELSEQSGRPVPSSKLGDRPDPGVYGIGRILMDEFHTMGGLTPTMIHHATSLIVSRVFRVAEQLPRESSSGFLSVKRLQPAINLIHDAPEKEFTLLELARLCHASVFHFARSFKSGTGSAPFALQRVLRLQKAQQLLVTTELSIEAVGAAVGIENATHFARLFRRHLGYSPREYRRLHLAKRP